MKFIYKIHVRRVIDGDTLEIGGVDVGFGAVLFTQRGRTKSGKPTYYGVRLEGVDTPETRKGWWSKGLSEEEIAKRLARGKLAKDFTKKQIAEADEVMIRSKEPQPDNFGRILADVLIRKGEEVHDLGTMLKTAGLTEEK